MNEPTKAPVDIYLTFCAPIDQNSVGKLMNSLNLATQIKAKSIHLLFQSTGGIVSDGICLYSFFKTFPLELTVYNVGSVQSIATIAYLGAKNRIASTRSTFMIHKTTATMQFATSKRIKSIAESVIIDDSRTESILKDNVNLTAEHWNIIHSSDLFFTGEESVNLGISQSIGEFSPPFGVQIYNVTS